MIRKMDQEDFQISFKQAARVREVEQKMSTAAKRPRGGSEAKASKHQKK